MQITNEEILLASANDAFKQLNENPMLGIPLDPDVADYMGAFEEKAISLDDILDDVLADVKSGGMYE